MNKKPSYVTRSDGEGVFAASAIRLPSTFGVYIALRTVFSRPAVAWSFLLAFAVSIQIVTGAFRTERGMYSDEAVHFMNGLLFRDYLVQGLGTPPLEFAEQYYLNYPKIAPLIWPPLFHVLLGFFMLPGWAPHLAALLLVAAAAGWTAWRLWYIVEATMDSVTAIVIAGTFLLTAAIADLTTTVMLDVMVAAFALEAMIWLSRFLTTERPRDAAAFGVFTALCCLTKINGLSLLAVPLIVIVLTRRFRLLVHPGLWLAALIVLVLAAPATILSFALDVASGAVVAPVRLSAVIVRTEFYSAFLWQQLGGVAILLALAGVVAGLSKHPSIAPRDEHLGVVLFALLVAAFAFHVLNPVEALSERYVALAVAPLLALAVFGARGVAARFYAYSGRRRMIEIALLVAAGLNFVAVKPAIAHRGPLGYRNVAEFLSARQALGGGHLLVLSDEGGEGAFVSEVAVREASPRATVIRGSKLLGTDDWNGHGFGLSFSSAGALRQELEDLHVDYIVVDRSVALPYVAQVDEMIDGSGGSVKSIYEEKATRRIAVYKLTPPSTEPLKKVRVRVSALQRVLEQR
jgi:dolichyl-phosphate-mannose-protein mannosyltransferase